MTPTQADIEAADKALEKELEEGCGFLERPYDRYRFHNGFIAGRLSLRKELRRAVLPEELDKKLVDKYQEWLAPYLTQKLFWTLGLPHAFGGGFEAGVLHERERTKLSDEEKVKVEKMRRMLTFPGYSPMLQTAINIIDRITQHEQGG